MSALYVHIYAIVYLNVNASQHNLCISYGN